MQSKRANMAYRSSNEFETVSEACSTFPSQAMDVWCTILYVMKYLYKWDCLHSTQSRRSSARHRWCVLLIWFGMQTGSVCLSWLDCKTLETKTLLRQKQNFRSILKFFNRTIHCKKSFDWHVFFSNFYWVCVNKRGVH